jgi:hypothetical protein
VGYDRAREKRRQRDGRNKALRKQQRSAKIAPSRERTHTHTHTQRQRASTGAPSLRVYLEWKSSTNCFSSRPTRIMCLGSSALSKIKRNILLKILLFYISVLL